MPAGTEGPPTGHPAIMPGGTVGGRGPGYVPLPASSLTGFLLRWTGGPRVRDAGGRGSGFNLRFTEGGIVVLLLLFASYRIVNIISTSSDN